MRDDDFAVGFAFRHLHEECQRGGDEHDDACRDVGPFGTAFKERAAHDRPNHPCHRSEGLHDPKDPAASFGRREPRDEAAGTWPGDSGANSEHERAQKHRHPRRAVRD